MPCASVAVFTWFLLTIVLNFRTGVMHRGQLVMAPADVARRYARSGWLFIDTFAALPIFALNAAVGTQSVGFNALRGLGMTKLLRIVQLSRLLDTLLAATLNPSVLRLLQLSSTICLLWHWTACLWWLIGTTTAQVDVWNRAESGSSWGLDPILLSLPQISQYLYALFWSVSVLTGLGAVEPPSSNLQCAYHILILVTKLIVTAMVVSQVTSTLSNFDAAGAHRRQKLDSLLEYLRGRNVPIELRKKVTLHWRALRTLLMSRSFMFPDIERARTRSRQWHR